MRERNAVDEQLTATNGSVEGRAQRHEVRCLVAPAFCARPYVMHVDERRVGAAWHAAAASIAREHGAAQRWRDTLLRPRARIDLGSSVSLRRGIGSLDGRGARPDSCCARRREARRGCDGPSRARRHRRPGSPRTVPQPLHRLAERRERVRRTSKRSTRGRGGAIAGVSGASPGPYSPRAPRAHRASTVRSARP